MTHMVVGYCAHLVRKHLDVVVLRLGFEYIRVVVRVSIFLTYHRYVPQSELTLAPFGCWLPYFLIGLGASGT